ncbi:spore cortex biosynthesis protein YabQ [Jeotgalibacillus proteolyticus]|uniref:Spore cortex biosynthesis protein YabQ n=1 Tax=Jeotgalibacillus proteolyticus TaxID=2082395 RepID=A0A2S5G6J0_9BACL|nr:spore cortex biosynthesis protein YabQ [Jeotgalibacillus proteolyticus]PPA68544.1 spore cortex biosynthesis protein YabQ [Jeotgalibacillus proteolyticus]
MILDLQLQVMSTMLAAGLVIGLNLTLYDRYITRSGSTGWRWVTDGVFWVVQALLVFILLFNVNGGEWRLYVLLSILCGFAGYEALVKKSFIYLLGIVDRVVKWVVKVITSIFTIFVFTPILWIWKLILLIAIGGFTVFCRILQVVGRIVAFPFRPFIQFSRKKGIFFAKKIKKWLNLLYNRE